MKTCNNCGNQMDDSAMVCPSCGAPAPGGQPQNQGNAFGQPQYNDVFGQPQVGGGYNGPQYGGGYGPNAPYNGLCIAGMVLGIVGLFLSFGGVIPLLAVVLSGVGLKQVQVMRQRGKGMAIAGLVMGIIGIIWAVYVIIQCVNVSNEIDNIFNRYY